MAIKKTDKLSPLTKSILATAKDMHDGGIMGTRGYKKITKRHLGEAARTATQPLTAKEIKALREKAKLSQAVFADYLNVTVGYVSKLERGAERPKGPTLVLLNVIHRKGIDAIL
jgi:putative transcriptional regulator